jgi:hypothetical protein
MIERKPMLTHHLFQIAVRELVSAIPPDAREMDGWLKVPSLEGGFILFHKDGSKRIMDE